MKADLRSLDFVINRFFMKLFKTTDTNIVEICQQSFSFRLYRVTFYRSVLISF